MLVFGNFSDLDKVVSEINLADAASVDAWEQSLGITSQRNLFNQIVAQEDAINDYQESLPPGQQSPTELHSALFQTKLASGLIKYVTDPSDASTYWDYAITNRQIAPAVNEQGLVKVEGKIYQFTKGALTKIVKDGDYSRVATLGSYTVPTETAYIMVVSAAIDAPCAPIDFSSLRVWKMPTNKKRVKVEIIGTSVSNFGDFSGPCAMMPYGATCQFQIRTQAQKKNFWGTWVYSSGFSPSLTISAATWSYRYTLFNSGCSGFTTTYTNTGINSQYPTPTFTGFWPATNNGTFGLNPNTSGWWLFNSGGVKRYITCAGIRVFTYSIPASYNIFGPSDWNLNL